MEASDLERRLLDAIEENPDTTQATLAAQLGVAVGSVNWYLRRLIRKGYVKVTHLQRRKLKYFLTPQGLALKAHLTSQYMKASLRVYRELREEAQKVLSEIQEAGFTALCLEAHGEAAEIFLLSCLECGVRVVTGAGDGLPLVQVDGLGFTIDWSRSDRKQRESEMRGANGL